MANITTQLPFICENSSGFNNCLVENVTNINRNTMQLPLAFFLDPRLINAYTIYLYVMIALGVPGNLLVLLVFLKHPPSTTTDWFILFITTFDFISSLVNVPIYATFTNGAWGSYGNNLICRIHMFLSQSFVLSSSFLICGLALDRYFKVCRPNSKALTKARARNYCIVISVLTFLMSTPCFQMYGNVHGRCVNSVTGVTIFFYYLMVFCTFVIATIAVVVSYALVSRAIFKSESNVNRHGNTPGVDIEASRGMLGCWCCKKGFYRNKVGPMSSMFADSVMSTATTKPSTSDCTTEADTQQPDIKVNIATSTNAWLTANKETAPNSLTPDMAFRRNESVRKKQASRMTVSLRTTKIAFLVCSIFVITWIPPWVSFFLAMSKRMLRNMKVIEFLVFGRMTYLLNTVTNPILYTWLNRSFRQRVKALLTFRRR